MDYIELGHMILIKSPSKIQDNVYYMPHQAVIKPESTTTKLRVRFDASSKAKTNVSLNELMHNGPRLQQYLREILLRWRTHQFVFTADIEKMYRQIKIAEHDQELQRVLWRNSPTEPIQEYKLTTVTYGTTSAPYLAVRTLQQLARDEADRSPEAAKIILRDFFVDDLMSGSYSVQRAKILQRELINVLRRGGFNLRKWKSNNKYLIENLPDNLKDDSCIQIKGDDSVKTLGVYWSPTTDSFNFKVKLSPSNGPYTKRTVLSDIARLFDPLGWLSPITITAKMMMQEIWKKQVEWDEPLDEKFAEKWSKFRKGLNTVETITVPRWTHFTPLNHGIEVHGFCDASEQAYGAVIYSKITTELGKVHITMLTSKTKVAPIKKITLPRLELCGAILLAKLIQQTLKTLALEDVPVYAWTDSQITLAWIKGDINKWKPFVSNRVTELRTYVKEDNWNYVKSEDNPADIASRGITPQKLKENELWWRGPEWMKKAKENWPCNRNIPETNEETKKRHQVALTTKIHTLDDKIITRFSSLRKLLRVIAYCKRFGAILKKQKTIQTDVTVKEIREALIAVVRMSQHMEWSKEITQLLNKQGIDAKSKILSLNPFLDENGVLRVGGRIGNSNIPFNERHPMLIPHIGHLTTLIIHEAHEATFHGGTETTLAFTRRRFWIMNGKQTIRRIIHKCIVCSRFKTQPYTQQMGELPSARVNPSKPFTHTGLDYAGPIQIRASKGRGYKSYKGYIAVFVCFSTKAIHIEAVTDMTAEAFLAAFKRFTSRRGLPAHLYSDNGTNFVGADRLLQQEFRKTVSENREFISMLTSDNVQWHFIPPAAPHFGGIWEAGVKSIKYHMKRIIGDSTLTFEELTTVLYQIEACLNSRPLCPLSTDPSNIIALTPGHFLIGTAINAPPESCKMDTSINTTNRRRLVQKMTQDFWKVWQSEYLSRLQQRTKWKINNNYLKIGQIVLIKDENLPPTKWPLARMVMVSEKILHCMEWESYN